MVRLQSLTSVVVGRLIVRAVDGQMNAKRTAVRSLAFAAEGAGANGTGRGVKV